MFKYSLSDEFHALNVILTIQLFVSIIFHWISWWPYWIYANYVDYEPQNLNLRRGLIFYDSTHIKLCFHQIWRFLQNVNDYRA